MRFARLSAILISVICWLPLHSRAQGCSDAGICTAPGFRQGVDDTSSMSANTLGLGLGYGLAQYRVHIVNGYAEYARNFGKGVNIGVKSTYAVLSGPLANNTDLSDLYVIAQYKSRSGFAPMIGIKLPFNRSDKEKGNKDLPMAYQTSLGTTDMLAGISYATGNWAITAGYQQPLVQNRNSFDLSLYGTSEIDQRYITTKGFERKADIMLRGYYHWRLHNSKWSVLPGVLSVYHTGNDTYKGSDGATREITGSRGLTLNINALITYKAGANGTLQATVGAPVIARATRPEGLSQISLLLEYRLNF